MLSDRYGRKWPLVYSLILVAVLELGAGFVQTFSHSFAFRSLFGIGMGGVWGLAAGTALENLPVEVRAWYCHGILQEGYALAIGYLSRLWQPSSIFSYSGSISWVEDAILDWVWLFFVRSGSQDLAFGE